MAVIAVFVAFAAAACGLAILWSLVPRRTAAPALGARLDAAAHPRLFAEIRAIATEFREPVPADVYCTLLPTLSVGQQGKTRSLQIGLPFLAVLRVTEFRAALAHEFAHFYGGDTGVGPRILKTHATLDRALRSFSSREGMMGFLARHPYSKPVHNAVLRVLASYWRLYLRLVLLIQRQWEFRADELACAVAGGEGVVSGLPKLAVATIGWAGYGINAAGPMLQLGCLPPIAEGFRRYIEESPAASAIAAAAAKRLTVASAIPGIAAASLQPIAWEEAAGRYARMWREFAEQHRELLAG